MSDKKTTEKNTSDHAESPPKAVAPQSITESYIPPKAVTKSPTPPGKSEIPPKSTTPPPKK